MGKKYVYLRFSKGREGKPIGRLSGSSMAVSKGFAITEGWGKICLVNRKSKVLPKIGEDWLCRIDKEAEKYAIVTPIKPAPCLLPATFKYPCGLTKEDKIPIEMVLGKPLDKPNNTFKVYAEAPKCHGGNCVYVGAPITKCPKGVL